MGAKAEVSGFNCFDQNLTGSLAENAALLPPRALASAPGLPLPTGTPGRGLSSVSDPVTATCRQISAGQALLVLLGEILWQKQQEKLRSEQPGGRKGSGVYVRPSKTHLSRS